MEDSMQGQNDLVNPWDRLQLASMLIGAAVGQMLVQKGILSHSELAGRVGAFSAARPSQEMARAAELAVQMMRSWPTDSEAASFSRRTSDR